MDGGKASEDQTDQRLRDDQEQALRFYSETLGFVKKTDFSKERNHWLTVDSPEEPGSAEL